MANQSHPVGTVRREDLPEIRQRDDVIAEEERVVDSAEFEVAEERSEEGDYPVGGVVYDRDDRILLIRNYWADGWTIPAGLAKHEETMDEAAIREIREETGVDVELVDVRYVKESEIVHAERGESLSGYFVIFEARATGDAAVGDPAELGEHDDEIEAVDWFEELPGNVYNRELVETVVER